MRVWVGICAGAALALSASSAGAVDYLFDNFNAEEDPSVQFVLNYNNFDNFSVNSGTVDLVSEGEFGIDTGLGFFVDLDGSSGNGGIIETDTFAFSAGDRIQLTFLGSGNQRNASTALNDDLFGGFRFLSPVSFTNVQFTGFTGFSSAGPLLLGEVAQVPFDQGWTPYSISFTALSSGSFTALIGTNSTGDNEGPLVDNVRVGAAVVPEPSTWAMMLLGFGGLGAVLRRRRATVFA